MKNNAVIFIRLILPRTQSRIGTKTIAIIYKMVYIIFMAEPDTRLWEVAALDDTKTRILTATMKAVRQYGLEGTRIQNISELAGLSPGALYRYFEGKDDLMIACFTYVDRQAAAIFQYMKLDPQTMLTDPMGAVRRL